MSHASFSSDDKTTLVFGANPSYPGATVIDSGMVTAETEGGALYAYRKSEGCVTMTLRFQNLPSDHFDGGYDYASREQAPGTQSLVNWFLNIAPPGGGAFTYTDPFGISRTVGFADGALDFSLTDEGEYSGSLRLKKAVG